MVLLRQFHLHSWASIVMQKVAVLFPVVLCCCFAVPVIQHCDFGIVSSDVLYVLYDETIYYLCICSVRKLHVYICCNYFLDALQYLFLDDDRVENGIDLDDRVENGIDLPYFWY